MKISQRFSLIIIFILNPFFCFSQVSIDWVARYNFGFGGDAGLAITTDDSGYVYVTGNSYGGPTRQDLVVLKYSKAGVNQWTRRIADTVNNSFMSGFDIEVDNFYNVYVGGSGAHKYDPNGNLLWSYSGGCYAIKIDTMSSLYTTFGGSYYLTRKFSASGNLIWQQTYQNLDYNVARDITLDKDNNVIVTGQSSQTFDLYDFVTIKYANNGTLIWLRRYDGGLSDYGNAIASDDSNNVYVTGKNQNASTDILTIKYSATGDTVWKSVYDSGAGETGYDIEVDSLENVYVAGMRGGSYVTLKYDKNGNLIWSRIQPSNVFGVQMPKIKLDINRNIYMSFVTFRPGLYSNYAVVKYSNDGVQQWIAEYNYGGVSTNYIYNLAVDNQSNVYVTGRSGSSMATVKFVQTPTQINQISNYSPDAYKLEQNYPNPFNPVTNLEFGISPARTGGELGFVSLKVYDVLGNEIETLVNEKKIAGSYKVEFDGSQYSSGVYFYRMTVDGNIIDTKRMLLLK